MRGTSGFIHDLPLNQLDPQPLRLLQWPDQQTKQRNLTMGLSGVSLPQLLILLAIVVLLFGTKRLRHLGEDLGSALKSFRKGLNEAEQHLTDDNANKK